VAIVILRDATNEEWYFFCDNCKSFLPAKVEFLEDELPVYHGECKTQVFRVNVLA